MDNNSGQISIDFMIGFTIFLLGFIFVAIMMSGLLIGLQSKTIDYDAVAYRTSVILVEDPGEPSVSPYAKSVDPTKQWEMIDSAHKADIIRLGLAIGKDYPNILSRAKVEKFFNPSFFNYPSDYREKLIFGGSGSYPYYFQIKLIDPKNYPPVGDQIYPEKFGFIKRAVYIKEPTNLAIIDGTNGGVAVKKIDLNLDFPTLYNSDRGPVYWIDPLNEEVRIKMLTNPGVVLTDVYLSKYDADGVLSDIPGKDHLPVSIDGGLPTTAYPLSINSDAVISFPAGYFNGFADKSSRLVLSYLFDGAGAEIEDDYDFDIANIQSDLTPAILEVRVW